MNKKHFKGPLATIVGTIVQGTGCGVWNDKDCDELIENILMLNCGSFNVYYLKPVVPCNYAYCMGKF